MEPAQQLVVYIYLQKHCFKHGSKKSGEKWVIRSRTWTLSVWWWSCVKEEEGFTKSRIIGNRSEREATSSSSRSAVPHTGSEWHSLPSKAPEFPPVQLALYPSLPPLDPSCTLSTRRKKNRETAEMGTQAGQAEAYRQCMSSKSPKPPLKKRNLDRDGGTLLQPGSIESVEMLVTLAGILITTFWRMKHEK